MTLAGLIAVFPYEVEPVREAVRLLKFHGVWSYGKTLAEDIAQYARAHSPPLPRFEKDHALVIPVPLAGERFRERGFNQAEVLAAELREHWGGELVAPLVRTRETKPQTELEGKRERFENVAGAFALRPIATLKGKTIVLVDDVYTTGATMNECARVLRRAGAKEVWGVVVARG